MAITSIKSKILILLLSLTGVVVISMALLMQFGFKQGFTAYKKSLAKDLNDRMVVALEEHYATYQTWQAFVDDPRAWHELIFTSATERIDGGPQKNKAKEHKPPRNRNKHRPPRDHLRQPLRNPELSRVLPSYSLFNSQQKLIIGNTAWGDKNTSIVKLNYQDKVVGYVVSSQLTRPGRKQDEQFNATFIKLLIMITAVMILVALMFTVPVARYFTRPIKALNQATKKAAGGDFSSKTHISRNDELGQLGQNFNLLTSTLASNAEVQKKMMADIAHDLRTPVAVLQAQIEAIQDGIHQADDKNLDLLHQQVLALGRLIKDLHQLSVADLGSMQYQMQAVDLNKVLMAVQDAQQLSLAEKELKFSSKGLTDHPQLVLGDPNRLQQLFMNLLDNSIAYTDSGGRVELAVSFDSSHNEYVISLEDSAPGLLPHELSLMFDRLYRKEGSRNKNSGGSGLGLAIVKNIVAAHHGSITAQAAELGGVCMTVRIPKHV